MSAIGSCVILGRSGFADCLKVAAKISGETTGRWLFQKTRVVGIEEFKSVWLASVVEEIPFGYSGYVLGNYLDAQNAINGPGVFDEQSEVATLLAKVFTAGFAFEQPFTFSSMARDKLEEFCREEYGSDDLATFVEAIEAAHEFYRKGMSKITDKTVAVFIIN